MINFNDNDRLVNRPEIIVEGGHIEGKVLSDSII